MSAVPESPQYDYARRRRATRAGRQKGCSIYIPADELRKAGHEPGGPLPWYRVWGSPRGVVLRLYRQGNYGD